MRIYLIGYMASGKSKLGRELADGLDYGFLDLDDLFEERYRISILDFFDKYDEQNFRRIEKELLHETAGLENIVIATGGGTPCFFDNMEFIRKHGLSVYLFWETPALISRLNQIRRRRPLIKDMSAADLETFIQKHLLERESFYRQADLVFDMQEEDLDFLLGWVRSRIVTDRLSD